MNMSLRNILAASITSLLIAIAAMAVQTIDPIIVSKLRCWNEASGMANQSGWGSTTPVGTGNKKFQIEFHIKGQTDKQIAVLYWSFRFLNKANQNIVQDFKLKRQ